MKYLLTALLILSAGTASAASGNLGADGNTQLPKITIIGITVSSVTFICLSANPSPLVEHQMWVLCSDSQAYITQNGAAVKLSTGGSGNVISAGTPAAGTLAQWQDATHISSFNVFGATNTWTAPQYIPNVATFLSSQSFTAASSFTFGLGAPIGASVDCLINYVQNTSAGYPTMQVNGDAGGSNYLSAITGSSGGSNSTTNDNGNYRWFFQNYLFPGQAGYPVGIRFSYITNSASSYTNINGQTNDDHVTNANQSWIFGNLWKGGNLPTYGTVSTSAGTMSGKIRCTYINY